MDGRDPERAVDAAATTAAWRTALAKVNPSETSVDLPDPGSTADPEAVAADLQSDLAVEEVELTFEDADYLAMMDAELRRLDRHDQLGGLTYIGDVPTRFDHDMKDRASGLYNPATRELYVAPEEIIGETPREREASPGYFSTDKNFGSVWHELGHHRIRMESPDATFEAKEGDDYWGQTVKDRFAVEEILGHDYDTAGELDIRKARSKLNARISDEVSEYAGFGGMEFIAEVYAGLMAGNTYSEEMMELHDRLSGPVPPVEARDPTTAFRPMLPPQTAPHAATAVEGPISEIEDIIASDAPDDVTANKVSSIVGDAIGVFPVTLPEFQERSQLRDVAATIIRGGEMSFTEYVERIGRFDPGMSAKYGHYRPVTGELAFTGWFPPEALSDIHSDGEVVGDDHEWLVLHELGHAVHHRTMDEMGTHIEWDKLTKSVSRPLHYDPDFDPTAVRRRLALVEGAVSNYARTNRLELVAEVFAGLCLGQQFPEEILEMYEDYHGPDEWRAYRERFHPEAPESPVDPDADADAIADDVLSDTAAGVDAQAPPAGMERPEGLPDPLWAEAVTVANGFAELGQPAAGGSGQPTPTPPVAGRETPMVGRGKRVYRMDADDEIRRHASENWGTSDLDSVESVESFTDDVVRQGLRCSLEGDCLTMSEAVESALDAVGIDAAVVNGQFDEGGVFVPHTWAEVHGGQLPIAEVVLIDPTAEQFMSEQFPHDTLVAPVGDEAVQRHYVGAGSGETPMAPERDTRRMNPRPLAATTVDVNGDTVRLVEKTPEEFAEGVEEMIEARPERGAFLTYHPPSELQGHTLLGTPDGKAGIAVSPEGDIQNLYRHPDGPGGVGRELIPMAIERGGCTLDCYDGFLRNLYADYGFRETGRIEFDPEYAPEGWNEEKYGHPDVVFMAYQPEKRLDTESQRYYDADEWEQAKQDSRRAADCRRGGEDARARVGRRPRGTGAGTGAPRGRASREGRIEAAIDRAIHDELL